MPGFSIQWSPCEHPIAYCDHLVAQEIRVTAYLTAYRPKRKARCPGVLPSQAGLGVPLEGVEPPTKRFVRDELTSPVISRPNKRLRTAWTCLTRARFSCQTA